MDEVFILLNKNNIPYLVLRNFEELENENMFIQGHPDVDMLCQDSQEVVRLLGAFSCRKVTPKRYGDGTHYFIYVKDRYVSLDLRHWGDDYYCAAWEKNLLKYRVKHGQFYTPSPENLFYSLIYHAIFQKKHFSDEYRQRLNQMQFSLRISDRSLDEKDFIILLEKYMKARGYSFVYPQDSCVPLMKKWTNSRLVRISLKNYLPHCLFQFKVSFIEQLVKIKHLIQK